MNHWEDEFGNRFETEEEARDDSYEKMSKFDLIGHLGTILSYTEILEWAMHQDDFWERFDSAIFAAQDEFFQDYYFEVEGD